MKIQNSEFSECGMRSTEYGVVSGEFHSEFRIPNSELSRFRTLNSELQTSNFELRVLFIPRKW